MERYPQTYYMNWYKNLPINVKINLKMLCVDLLGCEYNKLIKVLGMRLTIHTIYQKLKIENII